MGMAQETIIKERERPAITIPVPGVGIEVERREERGVRRREVETPVRRGECESTTVTKEGLGESKTVTKERCN